MMTMAAQTTQYGVKFVGYSAVVMARKYGREVEYATLDFITGYASVLGDYSSVTSKRADLGPLVRSLPDLKSELQALLSQHPAHGLEQKGSNRITVARGQNTICVAAGTDLKKFIRQITKRFLEIEQLLEQAEKIGSEIKRRPYSEYIAGIEKTGLAQVEGHGFALYIGRRLIFHPNYQVAFIKMVAPHLYEVYSLDQQTNAKTRSNA
jgi:hypothetical protein